MARRTLCRPSGAAGSPATWRRRHPRGQGGVRLNLHLVAQGDVGAHHGERERHQDYGCKNTEAASRHVLLSLHPAAALRPCSRCSNNRICPTSPSSPRRRRDIANRTEVFDDGGVKGSDPFASEAIARRNKLAYRWVPERGSGSHATLYLGRGSRLLKDLKKELGPVAVRHVQATRHSQGGPVMFTAVYPAVSGRREWQRFSRPVPGSARSADRGRRSRRHVGAGCRLPGRSIAGTDRPRRRDYPPLPD